MSEILRRIWLFFANKIKSSEYFSKQPTDSTHRRTQLIIAAHNCLFVIVVLLPRNIFICKKNLGFVVWKLVAGSGELF